MPRRDGTGPEGLGRMTGRRLGPCNISTNIRGSRRGLRRGYRQGFVYNDTKEELQREKAELQRRIEQIDNELK
ncbi:MAG: DUF5320 domain-containing protein [Bacillota bacterium]